MDSNVDVLSPAAVRMEAEVLPVINFCLQQNGADPVRSVSIENSTQEAVENVELRITASPEFILPYVQHMDRIPVGRDLTVIKPTLVLNGVYLAGLTEKVSGVLHMRLCRGEEILASVDMETKVLAFDQWHGLGLYPERLASFVTPNHPKLAGIIGRATEFLGRWTGDTSMDGYQSQDPNRVLSQAAAIFTAIKEQMVAYVVAPASFEEAGQRVRLCDMVLAQRLGNCLDLTLLYAACLEAAGLHPLLIAAPGHIFTGVWLEEKMFPECIQDDVSLITKRLASGVNEIAVVETTCVTIGADRSFDDARAVAEQNLTAKPVDCIIDVRRARLSHVLPLPQRIPTAEGWTVEQGPTFQRNDLSAPRQLGETLQVDGDLREDSLPKKVQWERKLLDLGLRNTLINLRLTRTQLPILTSSLDELENALADGSDFTVLPRPTDWKGEEFSFETLSGMGTAGIIQAEFEHKRLRSPLTQGELSKTIKELYRSARTALEENGANTLYLALGMLRWFETKRSTKPRYAPIILIPIEMVRRSAAQGYVIRLRDDEPQMNITLLEKLKQDFGILVRGVDPLPQDAHGIDIRRVLTILRQAVMDQPHWDVLEGASIGIFSFSQFVMWNDIRNRTDDLLRNKVVRSLMDGKLSWEAEPLELGSQVSEDGLLLPMAADASQMHAIQAACNGKSFVLHGPPGTGKSQTITSLIALALAQGKRVLFVAEKMAALEVVQRRLDSIGIGPFCLELHSNKSRKKDVLEQLRQASEVTRTIPAQAWSAKSQQIAAMRRELDEYARQLHKMQLCGRDLHTLIGEYEDYKMAPDITPFSIEYLKTLDAGNIENLLLVLERLTAAGREVGHPVDHPLTPVRCTQYTQSLRNSLQKTVEDYLSRLTAVLNHVTALTEALGEKQPVSYEEVRRLHQIAGNMACWYEMPAAWARTDFPQLYFEEVIQMAKHHLEAAALESQILGTFKPEFLKEDAKSLLAEFTDTSAKWFLPKTLGLNKLVRRINLFAKTPIGKESLQACITSLLRYRQETGAGDQLFQKYGRDLGSLYNGRDTDWQTVAELAAQAQGSARELNGLRGSMEHCGRADIREAVLGLRDGFGVLEQSKEKFDELLSIGQRTEENWLEGQKTLCRIILDHADALKEWTAYLGAATEARALGLHNAVDAYEQGADHGDIFPACKKALLHGLISIAIDDSGTLNRFSGAVFNKKIQQYQRMDQELMELSRQEAYCRLAAKVPDFTREAAHSSELGILQRCIKSGGRGVSIRKLFDQIPNLLPRLCPCMLMSPISAAQYLDPKGEPFDIVVFDEASQLPTCKAVGVLARGREAVVVGDPKQMPPTSFFAVNTVDEDNLDVEDLESILDDCLALNMPQAHLLWHYRSRHESLIAFSNSRFYENKLLTFPSVNDRESKVRLVSVDGVFERGKSRTNRAEAEAVVEELKHRCHDEALSSQSVGVVTFNISQQNLIDDLLNEACSQDPELEKWAFCTEEPVFIKNLENVQGDERDVILFSVGYGPDENGRVYMNFGPLNREGGWRRLNVAVSRARQEMVVFSTLRADQIDLNRTKAEGVAALRDFLEYAQGRPIALNGAGEARQTGLAAAICRALEEKGFETDTDLGRSAYRMDIGVVDPQNPDKYILGILLDGDSYGMARTTRDRELAQTGVLKGLGWNILRIWSMDWWDSPDKELKRIFTKLDEIRQGISEEKEPVKAEPPRLESRAVKEVKEPVYIPARLPLLEIPAEEFTEPGYVRALRRRIEKVLAAEAPVSASLLTKRVIQSCGITRAGSRIQGHLNAILGKMSLTSTTQEGDVFYWKEDPASYACYRVSGSDDSRRDVRDIPVQETANALCAVLYEQISMTEEDLLRETARKLGYARMVGSVPEAMALGIRCAEGRGDIFPGPNGAFVLTERGTRRAEAGMKNQI